MNKTPNYQLNQWAKSDRVLMEDFNADNAKIDAALAKKAETAALNALSQTVSGHTSALAGKGNCRIAAGSYTGSGTYGSDSPRTLSFPFQPKLVVVQNQAGVQADCVNSSQLNRFMMILVRPLEIFYLYQGMIQVHVSWNGNSVSWWADDAAYEQLNNSGRQYTYVALG